VLDLLATWASRRRAELTSSGPRGAATIRRRLRERDARRMRGGPDFTQHRASPAVALASFANKRQISCGATGLTGFVLGAGGRQQSPVPGDDGKAETVARQMRTRPSSSPRPTLSELIAAMSLSDLILSTDGGPMHLAAALERASGRSFRKTGQATGADQRECAILHAAAGDGITVEAARLPYPP